MALAAILAIYLWKISSVPLTILKLIPLFQKRKLELWEVLSINWLNHLGKTLILFELFFDRNLIKKIDR